MCLKDIYKELWQNISVRILLLLIVLIASNYSFAEIKVIEETRYIQVVCVGSYIFVKERDGDAGLTQYMYWSKEDKAIRPAKCSQWGAGIRTIEETRYAGNLTVMCIGGYVFVRKPRDGGITQYMYWNSFDKETRPALCTQYRGL